MKDPKFMYLDIKNREELTEEEKAKHYSKYYYMEMARPDRSIIEKIDAGPIDHEDALRIEDRNDLLNPGYLKEEVGYCVMPEGTPYVAMLTKMPAVTAEMFDWWFAWHPLENLRYKIWDPDDHFGVEISKEDRKRLQDHRIPICERNWGCTHYTVERLGEDFDLPSGFDPKSLGGLTFISPEDYGFDMKRFKPPNVATAICGPMCHFLRDTIDGVELRSRFWLGYKIIDKQPKLDPSSPFTTVFSMELRESIAKQLALHCMKEFTNLAKILPMVYAEESGNF